MSICSIFTPEQFEFVKLLCKYDNSHSNLDLDVESYLARTLLLSIASDANDPEFLQCMSQSVGLDLDSVSCLFPDPFG